MYYFDFIRYAAGESNWKMQYDVLKFISALQGVVNRGGLNLYINVIREADGYWLEKMKRPGGFLSGVDMIPVEDVAGFFVFFKDDIKGVILWDENVPATSNVASTVCGVDGWLPVRHSVSEDSFYIRYIVKAGIPVKMNLTNMFTGRGTISGSDRKSTGSAKCDAYIWAKENYLDKGLCNDSLMAFLLDGFEWKKSLKFDYDNAVISNSDYFIMKRAFIFDLSPWDDETPNDDPEQPVGCDYSTMKEILLSQYDSNGGEKITSIGGFVPWQLKYTRYDGNGAHHEVHTEWKYAEIISAHNAFMDAEAYGICGMANASIFCRYPLEEKYANNRPASEIPLENKTYMMFYMGDYDSAAWVSRKTPEIWDDPERGKVPLAWQFNPNLSDRSPHAFDNIFKTLTENDYIIAGDSGAGYINPTYLVPPRIHSDLPTGVDAWVGHCKRYYEKFDISITGFLLNGFLPLTEGSVRPYIGFSPDGCGYYSYKDNPRLPEMIDGVPFKAVTCDVNIRSEDLDKTLAYIYRRTSAETLPDFHIYRLILQKPSSVVKLVEALREKYPEKNFEPVDPYTFFKLFKENQRRMEFT